MALTLSFGVVDADCRRKSPLYFAVGDQNYSQCMKDIHRTIRKHTPKICAFLGIEYKVNINKLTRQRVYEIMGTGSIAWCDGYDSVYVNLQALTPYGLSNLTFISEHRKDLKTWEQMIAFIMAHELRHAVQFRDGHVEPYGPYHVRWKSRKHNVRKTFTGKSYNQLPWEKDANKAALAYIKSLKD